MGVKVREKSLKDDCVSFYLDINFNGRRWYEFLDIKASAKNRRNAEYVEKKKLAEKARDARQYQLSVEKIGLPDETKNNRDFYAFILERSANLKRDLAYKYLIKLIKDYCGIEVLPMDEITKELLLGFQEFLKKKGMATNTIYMVVHRFSTYINKAVEEGLMTQNPYQRIPRGLRVKRKRNTPDYLTVEQLELLATKSKGVPEQLKLAFFFSCFSGLRWSDCSRLKWVQVTRQAIDKKTVTVLRMEQMKTAHSTYVPLSEQAVGILEERRKMAEKEGQSPYVFPELYEEEGASIKHLRAAHGMTRWGKQAGLERLYFHLARHTFATLTLSGGADLYTVSKLLGHTSINNTMIYAHVVDRLKMEAVERLPKLSGNILKSPKRKAS